MEKNNLESHKKNSQSIHPVYDEYREVAHYWMLYILIRFGVCRKIMNEVLCHEEEVLDELGLSKFTGTGDFDEKAVRNELAEMCKQVESSIPEMPKKTQLAKNINRLGKAIGLNRTERSILHFRVIVSRHLPLRACLFHLGKEMDLLYIVNLLTRILGEDHKAVEAALGQKGKLSQAGLIGIHDRMEGFVGKICLSTGLADSLLSRHQDLISMFQDNFVLASPAKLSDSDYPHLEEDICLLASYLGKCLSSKKAGVNILIYGMPGGGKTEFVKMLAKKIGRPLYEIATSNKDGKQIKKTDRFRSFQLSQHILECSKDKSILLFDEVEDVFNISDDEENTKGGNRSGIKGWINKLLEENPVPAFWLTNNLRCLDKAFIRRFDYVIEIKTPPRSVRSKVLDHYLATIPVSQSWKAAMAEHEHLNPGIIERVAKVVEIANQNHSGIHVERALERALGNTLEAMNLPRSSKNSIQCVTDYRLDVLNTDCDVIDVCNGLREHGEGRLCMYGPPGTGKSAFGRYLADSLDRPLMIRRASDIISPWLGMTEKNLADMFHDAEIEKAVLLLDEADTFLRDRIGATRSWEVSEVNEMLTQMESFKGIFIASTNLMNSLDAASLRRFDIKVRFDFLKPDQAWLIFEDTADRLEISTAIDDRLRLDKISNLTPGDFANVIRQSRLRKISSTYDLIKRLEAECEIKPGCSKQKIGF